jgi:rod shape-determining protein MreB
VGERTAEEIKIAIGSALPQKQEQSFEIRGRDLIGGLPKNLAVKSNEITEAIADQLREIVQAVKEVLHNTPPELSADVMDKGMVLSGGGALLKNIDELICQATGVPCFVAKDPLLCVARGAGIALEHLDIYKRSVMSKK